MKQIFKKAVAGFTAAALVVTLLVGFNFAKKVKAAEVQGTWEFSQGGQYNPSEQGNEGYLNSVNLTSGESITGWPRGDGEASQVTKTATQAADGFTIDIENTGWDAQWKAVTGYPTDRINPWSIQSINRVAIEAGHTYTVSFTAKASKKKYMYVAFGTNVEGIGTPYDAAGLDEGSDGNIVVLGTAEKTFTYTFTNWTSVTELATTLMMGAFDAQYDYAGENVSDIITEVENVWKGQIIISNFKVTDHGRNPEFVEVTTPERQTTQPPTEPPTIAPTTQAPTTQAPTTVAPKAKKLGKVKKLVAKNIKGRKIKVTWKKVKYAKKYQVKVGNKIYTARRNKFTTKRLKKGKRYTIKVRAKARAGYKAGAWSRAKKVKIKK